MNNVNTLANAPTLAQRARNIRRNALRMGEVQGQGYIAQALDIADVLAVAYFHAMRFRPEDPVAALLSAQGVHHMATSHSTLLVPPDEACGTILEFAAAP